MANLPVGRQARLPRQEGNMPIKAEQRRGKLCALFMRHKKLVDVINKK